MLHTAAVAPLCVTDRTGFKPPPKPALTDFCLQPYVVIVYRLMVSIPVVQGSANGRLSWPSWLTHSGQFTHNDYKVVT